MIYYFTPYALDKDLGSAYNDYMTLLPTDEDWACFIDADTMFITPDFGHQIQEIVNEYPDTGMFTCYTNRVGNTEQCWRGQISNESNLRNLRKIGLSLQANGRHKVKEIKAPISGVLMLIQKKTWKSNKFKKGLLTVDNAISKKLESKGRKILLMEGVYLIHYYRLNEGRHYKAHLKPEKTRAESVKAYRRKIRHSKTFVKRSIRRK